MATYKIHSIVLPGWRQHIGVLLCKTLLRGEIHEILRSYASRYTLSCQKHDSTPDLNNTTPTIHLQRLTTERGSTYINLGNSGARIVDEDFAIF